MRNITDIIKSIYKQILSDSFIIRITLIVLMINVHTILANPQAKNNSYEFNNFENNRFKYANAKTLEAEKYFNSASKYFLNHKDTLNYLLCASNISNIQFRKGNYHQAFETIYNILPLAQSYNNKKPLLELNRELVFLYNIYGKDDLALKYALENLNNAKKYYSHFISTHKDINKYKSIYETCYLSIANQALTMNKMILAKKYLDSCTIVKDYQVNYYVKTSFAQYYLQKKDYNKALSALNGVANYMNKIDNGFIATVFRIYGEIYQETNKIDSAVCYYKKSINAIDKYEVSLAGKPDLLYRLSNIYYNKNDYKTAFIIMKEAKNLTDFLYKKQSIQNNKLFDIKNLYREQLNEKGQTIKQQKNEIDSLNKNRLILISFIVLIIVVFAIIIIYIRLKTRIKHILSEKEINDERNEAILDEKNRELTANALQFIEKEKIISQVVDIVKNNAPHLTESIKQKISQNNNQMWESFNTRFIETNGKFYDNLLAKHPSLTSSDLKLCALLRLNFDSKEMARILGISVASVHVSRSRMRKRLLLAREDNLHDYLNQF